MDPKIMDPRAILSYQRGPIRLWHFALPNSGHEETPIYAQTDSSHPSGLFFTQKPHHIGDFGRFSHPGSCRSSIEKRLECGTEFVSRMIESVCVGRPWANGIDGTVVVTAEFARQEISRLECSHEGGQLTPPSNE